MDANTLPQKQWSGVFKDEDNFLEDEEEDDEDDEGWAIDTAAVDDEVVISSFEGAARCDVAMEWVLYDDDEATEDDEEKAEILEEDLGLDFGFDLDEANFDEAFAFKNDCEAGEVEREEDKEDEVDEK